MSDHRALLADTAHRAFAGLRGDFTADWATVEAAGLPWVMASEDAGGIGGGFEDASAILFAAGRHAVALPMAEAIVGAALLAETGIAMDGALTLARRAQGRLTQKGERFTYSGTLEGVAFGAQCPRIAALVEQDGKTFVACFNRADADAGESRSDPADTPYDSLRFAEAEVAAAPSTAWTSPRLFRAMALARACQISGAIDAALALSADYVAQRQQFGRPLAKFQAIQQQMAVMVEEAAAANAAAMAAARAADEGAGEFRNRRGEAARQSRGRRGRQHRPSGAWRHRLHARI